MPDEGCTSFLDDFLGQSQHCSVLWMIKGHTMWGKAGAMSTREKNDKILNLVVVAQINSSHSRAFWGLFYFLVFTIRFARAARDASLLSPSRWILPTTLWISIWQRWRKVKSILEPQCIFLTSILSDLCSMAIKFKDGVILGADSRTTTGPTSPHTPNVAHIQALQSQTESQTSSLKSTTRFGVAEVDLQQTPKPSTILSNTTFPFIRTVHPHHC